MTDAIRDVLDRSAEDLRVALPAHIVSWDAAAPEEAAVQPAVTLTRRAPSGALLRFRPPPVPRCPIVWPGAGENAVTWPLSPGDTGLVVWADRAIDDWLLGGGLTDPPDPRRHSYADAVFVPGLRPLGTLPARATPIAGATVVACPVAGSVRLGASAASQAVAVEPLVAAQLAALVAAISAAPVAPGDGGAAFKAALLAALAGWPGPMGALRVFAE